MDYLVFFTIFCTVARRYGMQVLALCPMPDHIHNVLVVPREEALIRFVQQYTHLFAREWNLSRGRKGSLFKARYKSSVKLGNKQVRTTLNYNDNNPVERKIVLRAEDYRWNFLRYATEKQPFSAPYRLSEQSAPFRGALKELQTIHLGGGYLRYNQLLRWSRRLSEHQMQQLMDYAIALWNVIDYEQATAYYSSFSARIRSLHDNTGSDYDIQEERNNWSDAIYRECTEILLREGFIKDVFEIYALPPEIKQEAAKLLRCRTSAHLKQIQRFLHIVDDA